MKTKFICHIEKVVRKWLMVRVSFCFGAIANDCFVFVL